MRLKLLSALFLAGSAVAMSPIDSHWLDRNYLQTLNWMTRDPHTADRIRSALGLLSDPRRHQQQWSATQWAVTEIEAAARAGAPQSYFPEDSARQTAKDILQHLLRLEMAKEISAPIKSMLNHQVEARFLKPSRALSQAAVKELQRRSRLPRREITRLLSSEEVFGLVGFRKELYRIFHTEFKPQEDITLLYSITAKSFERLETELLNRQRLSQLKKPIHDVLRSLVNDGRITRVMEQNLLAVAHVFMSSESEVRELAAYSQMDFSGWFGPSLVILFVGLLGVVLNLQYKESASVPPHYSDKSATVTRLSDLG